MRGRFVMDDTRVFKIRWEFSDGHLFKNLYLQKNLMPEWFIEILMNGKEKYWYQVSEDHGRLDYVPQILSCAKVEESKNIVKERTYIVN